MQLFSRNKAIVALSLGALALGACGDDVTVPVTPAAPITLSITPPSANMNIGESVNFAVQISGGSATSSPTITCTSSSATVATATVSGSACRVTAVAAGNATITAATSTGQSAAASVSVAAPAAAISGLQVSPTAASVPVNQTVTIVPTFNRAGSAVTGASQFTTSNAAVATVNATTGVVTAVAPGVATITVSVTGSGTGFTTTTLTAAAAITVTALPTGITSLNVTPATLSLASGATATIVASAQQPAGATAATITFGTTAPAVATVNATGVVTAVGPGTAVITATATSAANANFAAATLSGTVAVTVSPAAQISISSITQGLTLSPVDVNNVNGQIQVNTNLVTNGQLVTAVSAWVCRVGETVADCATRSGTPAAQQQFGAGGAANGAVSMTINTADFTVASDWSSASTKFNNGQNVVVATISTAGGLNAATSNLSILNFTNADGFAARHVAPTTTATTTGGLAYFGGPGATGRGSISIVPVTYTAGRTVKAATASVPAVAGCTGTVAFTSAATPWTYSYGYTTASGAVANAATNLICNSAVATLDVTPVVSASTYNDDTAGPTASGAQQAGLVANSFRTISSSATPVTAPASIRVDYATPTLVYTAQGTYATAQWINNAFNFNTTAATAGSADVGVGLAPYRIESTGCPIAATPVFTTMATATGADLNECATDLSNAAYRIRVTALDRLGNASAAATQATFGVDKTAPVVRLTASTDTNNTRYSAAPAVGVAADTVYQPEALDERSGLASANYRASRATRAIAVAATGYCLTGGATATVTPQITANACTYTAATGFDAPLAADGYRPVNHAFRAFSTSALTGEGYYNVQVNVLDRAGNTSEAPSRLVLTSMTTPLVTATAGLTTITSTTADAIAGTSTDQVEVAGTSVRLGYGATILSFPATATAATAFDNAIFTTSAITGTLPFTSGVRIYTNLEQGLGGANDVLSSTGFNAYNFGGFAGNGGVAPFGVTQDAVTWGVKAATLTSFVVAQSTAGFNAPAGGIKARATGTMVASPFTRVDFYMNGAAGSHYLGSVDASASPCTAAASTCGVYVSDNGVTRDYTFVLRSFATSPVSLAAQAPVVGSQIIAIATTGTSGRGLVAPATALTVAP